VAFDILLQRETDANWSRGKPSSVLPIVFSPQEIRALKLLEPSTRTHVVEVLGWARSRGIPARLSTQSVVYSPAEQQRHYEEGRSGVPSERLGWHQVGRAYHLAIFVPGTKQYDDASYARVAAFVRSKGGDWLGDKVVVTPKGPVRDTAHFEYHPSWDIATYRKLPLAQVEYRQAQQRNAKYG
jgi:hypothetical protein